MAEDMEFVERLASDDALFSEALESLSTAQAVYKAVSEVVSTKSPTSLRHALDTAARIRYERGGQSKWTARTCGQKVGEYLVSVTKEQPEQHRPTYKVVDADVFKRWLATDDGQGYVWSYVYQHLGEIAQLAFADGVFADGCDVVDEVTPAVPSKVRSCVLKVDGRKVAAAMGESLPTAVAALVGEGE